MAKKVKGEAAFDAFVELIDPIFEVAEDEELRRIVHEEKASLAKWLSEAIKRHKETMMKTLSILTGEEAKDMDFVSVYRAANELMRDRDLLRLFLPKSQTTATSGSATESIEEGKK